MIRAEIESLARQLVDIDSTTGREGEVCAWTASWLRQHAWTVEEMPVEGDRFNLFATSSPTPALVFSTHLDCVPPFFPSRVESGLLFGRGACDAKGIAAAQIGAANLLRDEGASVGLLLLVGEEQTSDGARTADRQGPGASFLVNGEPTENRLGRATRGSCKVRFVARGRAAHSACPHRGQSAIDHLIEALTLLRSIDLPTDPELGRTHYNVGSIAGGLASNVTAPRAEALVHFRTVGDVDSIRAALEPLKSFVTLEEMSNIPPVKLNVVPGFETEVFSYVTDIQLLTRWGQPYLLGPGSIAVAHTDDEHVALDDLVAGVGSYTTLARRLLLNS
jgi:acetylornithine deacetylase